MTHQPRLTLECLAYGGVILRVGYATGDEDRGLQGIQGSLSTLDRWIAAGRVQVSRETRGRRHRVYVVMSDGGPGDEGVLGGNAHRGEEILPPEREPGGIPTGPA